MSKKKPEIDQVVEERRVLENTPATHMLALRSEVAIDLLKQETEEYRAAVLAECVEMQAIEKAAYEAQEDRPTPSPLTQTE